MPINEKLNIYSKFKLYNRTCAFVQSYHKGACNITQRQRTPEDQNACETNLPIK